MKRQFRITINDKSYEVIAEVLDEEGSPVDIPPASSGPRRSRSVSASTSAASSEQQKSSTPQAPGESGGVPSPLAGKVVSIETPAGTAVKAGDTIITLEAMKMNTVVSSPVDGTVEKVHVRPGDSVEEGQTLMTIS